MCMCEFRYWALSRKIASWHAPSNMDVVLGLDEDAHTLVLGMRLDGSQVIETYGPEVSLLQLLRVDLDVLARRLAEKAELLTRAADDFERAMETLSVARTAARREVRRATANARVKKQVL